MSFYYLREPGTEGQLLTEKGEAPGVPLSDLLDQGPLPHRVALELIGSVSDILTIAEEDGATHGDLKPGVVKIDGAGAVAVEGFGQPRRGGRAPEGAPVGITTDTYGMGLLLHAMLTAEAFGVIPRQRDEHDQVIVDRLLGVDWVSIKDRKWFDDVLRFICSMLSFEPGERPHPLDVANIFYEVVTQLDPPDLTTWAAQRMGRVSGGRSTPTETVEEDLGGPTSLNDPMSGTGGFRVAASAKGESTAFWSKERIAALLADDEDDEGTPPRRQVWSPTGEPHRPSVAPLPGPDSVSPVNLPEPPRNLEPPAPPRPPPLRAAPRPEPEPEPAPYIEPPRVQPPRPEPEPQAPPPRPPFNIQGPIATAGGAPRQPVTAAPEPESSGGGGLIKVVLALSAVLFLVCAGGGAIGAFLYLTAEETTEPVGTDIVTPNTVDVPEVEADTAAPEELPPEELPPEEPPPEEPPPEKPPPTRPPPSSSGSSSSNGSTSRPPPPEPPPPEPTGGPMTVKVVSQGSEATLRCGDGQQRTFVGSTRMSFETVTTCRIDIGDVRGVFQASATGTITCTESGGSVSCQ
ncbi:MAG: hypothetical protein ACI8RZ_005005 [Myxococcota bacterium]